MRDILSGDGFSLTDTGIPGKGLGNYSSIKIDGFSPSMKLVLNILENHGPLTQKEITKVTRLPTRTVRYALNRLKQEDILEEREYFQDARQCLYQIK
ncbi:MAG: helix-turn-helix domain-containing protein [Candidatus Methanoperedens sp.]|nr:helix-turn-helix domain-containing protein [Candidatus Methanoperedens sp.]MCZ7393214.1 helix-turn-helix domain-containing protein [Candidatus Methanoperedens sp.]